MKMYRPNPNLVDGQKDPVLWFKVLNHCAAADYFNGGGSLEAVSDECFTEEELGEIAAGTFGGSIADRLDHIHGVGDSDGCMRCNALLTLGMQISGRHLPLRVYDPEVREQIEAGLKAMDEAFDRVFAAKLAEIRAGKL